MKVRVAMVSVVLFLVALGSQAQVGILFGGEVRLGAAWFVPNGGLDGLSLDSSVTGTLDYTHQMGQHFAWNLNYTATTMSIQGHSLSWYRPKANVNLQAFGFSLQFHFSPTKHLEPYFGAGLNYLYSANSSGMVTVRSGLGAERVSASGGMDSGAIGPTFQAGLDWKIKGPFLLNFEAKYMDNSVKMDRYIRYNGVSGYFFPAGTAKMRVDPLIFSAGIGFRW